MDLKKLGTTDVSHVLFGVKNHATVSIFFFFFYRFKCTCRFGWLAGGRSGEAVIQILALSSPFQLGALVDFFFFLSRGVLGWRWLGRREGRRGGAEIIE